MYKAVRLLFILVGLVLLLGAKKYPEIKIFGIRGKLLTNVKFRLEEFVENKKELGSEDLKQQIESAMHPFGYFKPEISLSVTNSSIEAHIFTGPRLKITYFSLKIEGEGKDNYALKKHAELWREASLKAFSSLDYEAAKLQLHNIAEQQGYIHAKFEQAIIEISKDKNSAVIKLRFNTGSQYFFGQVRFDPSYISPELLHRYVHFSPNEPYSFDKVRSLNDALRKSGYFKAVNSEPLKSTNSHLPLAVHLEPITPLNYTAGLGYGTDTGIRGRASMNLVPVNRHGDKFSLLMLGSMKENSLQTQYLIPSYRPETDVYELNASISNLNYNSGYSNSFLTSFAKRHTESSFQRILSINNLYERFSYTYQPKHANYALFPKASFNWQKKTDILFSPEGYSLNINGLGANKSVLSSVSFSELSLDAKAAIYLNSIRTRIYGHTLGGLTQIKNINQLPLSQALLLGGSDNLKAYDYNSIGPGKILGYAGLEFQKETTKNWYLLAFADIGTVYNPNPQSVKKDVGLGIMWVSPIGPIKISLAEQIDDFRAIPRKYPKLVINIGPDL